MKHLGNPDIRGQMLVTDAPTDATHVMRKQDVEALVGGTAPVFITDVTPTGAGIVASKNYVAGTIPANQILADCIANTYSVRVHFLVEGGSAFYSPTVDINGTQATITEHATDKRLFEGYADIVMAEDGQIIATSSSGSSDLIDITFLVGGPVVQTLTVDTLPGSQTEVKSGDVIAISGTVENSALSMDVKNLEAVDSGSVSLGADDSAGAGFKTFSGTAVVSNETGLKSVSIAGTNFLGTEGDAFASADITLNQTYPSIANISVAYAVGDAMRGTDSATVTSAITNVDTVAYVFDHGTVTDPSVYAADKIVTRVSGDYVTTNNYHITATKTSNGATSTYSGAVLIANTAPTGAISILGNPVRLSTSPTGLDYTVQLTPDQILRQAPGLTPSVGTWQGDWYQSGNNWRRVLRVDDADARGAASFGSIQMTNKAWVVGTVVSGNSYTVGGLSLRSITFAAFSQIAPIGAIVANINKTTAIYAGASEPLVLQANVSDVVKGYTIVDSGGNYDPNGDHLWINDVAFAGSNTSGTLVVEFEEVK